MGGSYSESNLPKEMETDELNGFKLKNHYIPSEVLMLILSQLPPKDLLNTSLVCKNWNKIVKDELVWKIKYEQVYRKKPKRLPWYVYYALFATNLFDKNFIKNGNGQEIYKHWIIKMNFGDGFIVENPPCGCPTLPIDDDFEGHTGCFATSYHNCKKLQEINLNRKLFKKILNQYKPHIFVSEWVCGRFDCGCTYVMKLRILPESGEEVEHTARTQFEQWSNPQWEKLSLVIEEYPDDVNKLIFEHSGRDSLFWKGHYGSKMAGAVVKILFDTLKDDELSEDPAFSQL